MNAHACVWTPQGLDSRRIVATSDERGIRSLLDDQTMSHHDAQAALGLASQATRLEYPPKVRIVVDGVVQWLPEHG